MKLFEDLGCNVIVVSDINIRHDIEVLFDENLKNYVEQDTNVFLFLDEISEYQYKDLFHEIIDEVNKDKKTSFSFYDYDYDLFDFEIHRERFNKKSTNKVDNLTGILKFYWKFSGYDFYTELLNVPAEFETYLLKEMTKYIEKETKRMSDEIIENKMLFQNLELDIDKLYDNQDFIQLNKEGLMISYILENVENAQLVEEIEIKRILRPLRAKMKLHNLI